MITESVDISEARQSISDLISRVQYQKERVIIRRSKKEVAGIIPIELLSLLERLIEKLEDQMDLEEVTQRLRSKEKPIPYDKARKDLDLA